MAYSLTDGQIAHEVRRCLHVTPTSCQKFLRIRRHVPSADTKSTTAEEVRINRRVRNILESHLFRSAEKNVPDESIFQN